MELCPANDIFQDFVQRMADVEIAIGIWWSIMQDK